jgi:hypothetical protein
LYVSDAGSLAGLHPDRIVCVGEYWNNSAYVEASEAGYLASSSREGARVKSQGRWIIKTATHSRSGDVAQFRG